MKSYLNDSSSSYPISENGMTGDFDHSHSQNIPIQQKKGLTEIFSQDTIEQHPPSPQEEKVNAKKTAESGLFGWILSFFVRPASQASQTDGSTNTKTNGVGSLESTSQKSDAGEQQHLQRVIQQLKNVNQQMKEFNEEINLDKQFMEMHLALAQLKEELATAISQDIHKTHKANKTKKGESQKKLDELVEIGRKKAWASTIQSGLFIGSLVGGAGRFLGVPGAEIVTSSFFIVSQLLTTVTSEYYKIKHNSLDSAHIGDQAEIKRSHKKIEGLLGELKGMTDSALKTRESTGSLLKNHHAAVSSIQQQ